MTDHRRLAPQSVPSDVNTTTLLLADADEDVRLRAAVDLGTWRAAEAAPALVARLGVEPSHPIRETLTWALLRMPDAARPLLMDALGDPNWLLRLQACHVLSKQGRAGEAEQLLPVIADPVDAVASRAWWAAGQTGSALVVDALAGQLGRGDSELRNSLSIAFEALGGVGVSALVRRLQRGSSAAVREHAADTLGLIGSPAADVAVLPLREAIDDPDGTVGFAALNAVGQLAGPRAQAAVRSALGAGDARVRALADRLVRRLRPAGAPVPLAADDAPLTDGVVAAAPHVLVALRCTSAGLAESRALRDLAQRVAAVAENHPAADLPGVVLPDGRRVGDALQDLSAMAGEPVGLGPVERLDGPCTAGVLSVDGLPRVGVLVGHTGAPDSETDRIVAKLVQQVALCSPRYVHVDEVPPQEWAAVQAAALQRAAAAGVGPHLHDRVVAGAAADYATRHVLLQQVSITDPGLTIDGLLYGRGIRVTGVRRISLADPS